MSVPSIRIPPRPRTRTRTARRRRRTTTRTTHHHRRRTTRRRRRDIHARARARTGRGRRGGSSGAATAHSGAERTLAAAGARDGGVGVEGGVGGGLDVGEAVVQGAVGVGGGEVRERGGDGEGDGGEGENEREGLHDSKVEVVGESVGIWERKVCRREWTRAETGTRRTMRDGWWWKSALPGIFGKFDVPKRSTAAVGVARLSFFSPPIFIFVVPTPPRPLDF